MSWVPPAWKQGSPLREKLPEDGWRIAIEQIAEKHGLAPCELAPYAKGETIVWRAGEHVIKLTTPRCAYQIEAEVGCLGAVQGKLSLETPRLLANGSLSGWPYVIMSRIGGRPLSEVWQRLAYERRRGLARELGVFCRDLHALSPEGFRTDWAPFWREISTNVGQRNVAVGGPPRLLAQIDPFLAKVGELTDRPLVPLHTELIDQHIYVEETNGQVELRGLIDFADARLGPAHYEFGGLVEFIFRGEPGLLRELMLAYGVAEADLTPRYSETLLAWALCGRFATLQRVLALLPAEPASLEDVAASLFSLAPR